MKQSGIAIWGIPIYSDPEPVDFIFHWLRCSWASFLPGKLLDQSNDTYGYYICAVSEIDYPRLLSTRQLSSHMMSIEIEASFDLVTHGTDEDSVLRPDFVFLLSNHKATLSLSAEVEGKYGEYVVRRVHLRPYSNEGAGAIGRYGGPMTPYVCDLQHENWMSFRGKQTE